MDKEEKVLTLDDLKEMQAWPLERKIQVTQTRVIEWYTHYNGQVYISFSGGKDSTVLLDLVRRAYPDVPAVFVDTKLEYPELRKFVATKENVIWLEPEMNFKEVIKTYGYPFPTKEVASNIATARHKPEGKIAARFEPNNYHDKMYNGKFSKVHWKTLKDSDIPISNKCCDIMKKNPVKKYEKETGRRPILGTLADESRSRKNNYLKSGCNSFNAKRPLSQPLSFWTEQDILKYLKDFNIPYASVYGEIKQNKKGKYYTTGCNRTGCVFCLFGIHLEKEPNRLQQLKETHPKLYDYCMRPLEEGGLGEKAVIDFVNKNCKLKKQIPY